LFLPDWTKRQELVIKFLFELNKVDKRGTSAVKDVISLAVHPSEKTEYLLGAEAT